MSRFSLRPNVVNFKNHFDELSCQTYLLLLANQRFYYVLFFHICKNEIEENFNQTNNRDEQLLFTITNILLGGGGGGGGG